MDAAPGEEDAVLGGELDECHRIVEPGREAISRQKALGEPDAAGIVEIDQAGVELDETAASPPTRPLAVPHMASAIAVMKCPRLPVSH